MQGGCINNGRLYIAQGYIGAGYILLNVVNLRGRKLEKQIDLMDYGVRWEPEGCFYYDDAIMLSSGSNIWRIDFEQPVDTGINNIGL